MKKAILIAATAALMTLTYSCKKQGCTDTFADNYAEDAEVDDGTCTFTQTMIFYLNDSRHDDYSNNSGFYAPFHFYIDGEKIGELSTSSSNFQTYNSGQSCTETNGVFRYDFVMENKFESVTIDIKDQLDNSHGSITKSVALSDGDCSLVLL